MSKSSGFPRWKDALELGATGEQDLAPLQLAEDLRKPVALPGELQEAPVEIVREYPYANLALSVLNS